jgi:hypothetical protein
LHQRGETKKIYFASGESKEKKNYREKTKLTHITGVSTKHAYTHSSSRIV